MLPEKNENKKGSHSYATFQFHCWGGDVGLVVAVDFIFIFTCIICFFFLFSVDNSFQFDATRDLLRELDVNDIVWIGLMRPQSSDRFMWS